MSTDLPADPTRSKVHPRWVHEVTSEAFHTAGNGSSSSDTPKDPDVQTHGKGRL